MTTTLPVPSAPPVPGTPLPPAVLVMERGPVTRFAEAVRDSSASQVSPADVDGIAVPPTFLFAASHWGMFPEIQPTPPDGARTLLDLVTSLRADGGMVLHGEQEFAYEAPIRVGDVLHVTGVVEDVVHKPGKDGRAGLTVMTVRTEYRSEDGDLLVTARATFVHRP
ncbi:MAG: hypothetical protein QOG99_399 [Frankiales bacterium]|jgi:hydroxyacyl-ACP dehydratase HTD2-like protein with hotdog domain|nr:hypothetical protein [Frankiales bacterium]